MGNTLSEGSSPMAIAAMSNYTVILLLIAADILLYGNQLYSAQHFEKHELGRLRDQVP